VQNTLRSNSRKFSRKRASLINGAFKANADETETCEDFEAAKKHARVVFAASPMSSRHKRQRTCASPERVLCAGRAQIALLGLPSVSNSDSRS
jgi:hypothetical protein